ncbi:hypothetical protein G6F58_011349 [Rhizopus delemar]|nr:hypothetical protein G6F58_011349 [Rhizopus delemar]
MEQGQINILKQYLQDLKLPKGITKKQAKYLQKEAPKFTIYRDTLYRYNTENGIIRKVLNEKEAEEIMYSFHQHPLGGHLAYNNTLHKIASRYYWDNMTKDIMEYVTKCHRCQKYGKKSLNEELYPVAVSTKPFDRIALDVKHVQASRTGYRYIIAAIDYLTKYVEAKPIRFQTASEISLFLYEEIICRHGCPTIIVSDNGKPFLSKLLQEVCKTYTIIHKTTTPYNPQSNGLIERFNRTLGQILQKRSKEEKEDWDAYLPAALFAYRTIKQASTQQTPFFLLYGYEPKTPFDLDYHIYERNSPKFDAILKHRTIHQIYNLNKIRETAVQNINRAQETQRKQIENKILDERKELKPPFRLGDLVLIYRDYLSTSWSAKLQDKWEGPYVVQHILGKGTYHIKSMNPEDTKLRRVHGNRMKPYLLPKVQWCQENQRQIITNFDDETFELLQ